MFANVQNVLPAM